MNFIYLDKVRNVLSEERLTRIDVEKSEFHYGGKNNSIAIYFFKIGKYDQLHFRFTSSVYSYGRVCVFFNADGKKFPCIFIPSYDFLVSCIILRDLKTLKESKKWMNYITDIFTNLDTCYKNSDTKFTNHRIDLNDEELIKCIPSQFPINARDEDFYTEMRLASGYPSLTTPFKKREVEVRQGDSIVGSAIVSKVTNYDPASISAIIQLQNGNDDKKIFLCSNMLEYHTLLDSGIDKSRIRYDLNEFSLSKFLIHAARDPMSIANITESIIVDYIMSVNEDDVSKLIYINQVDSSVIDGNQVNLLPRKRIIDNCIKQYQSLDKIPEEVMDELLETFYDLDPIASYMKPIIDYMFANDIPIFSRSPVFEALFPEVPTLTFNHSFDRNDMTVFSRWSVDYTKQQFLALLAQEYDYIMMMKLYELFLDGFISKKDIIKSGLYYVYGACWWMLNRHLEIK